MTQESQPLPSPTTTPPAAPPDASGNELLDRLVNDGHLSPVQAETVRRRMKRSSISCHQAVIELEYCPQEILYRALSAMTGLPFVVLHDTEISEEARKLVSPKAAIHYRFVPLQVKKGSLEAAFANPPNVRDLENLRLLLGRRIEPRLATAHEVTMVLKTIYGLGAETVIRIQERLGERRYRGREIHYETSGRDLGEDREAAPIISLVNQILIDALEMNATDIHIEPYPENVHLRYRIDGMLQEIPVPPGVRDLHDAIISRLKIMADLNIAERRLPHDGRIRVRVGKEEFDLRVSILPTRFGETMCLRILNRRSIFYQLSELGLEDHDHRILQQLINLPHGIVLVTGPTGSGKTTTLYASLSKVLEKSPERKIITVEDPVEYELPGVSQIQMHSEIGLTFASGLRSILRHDPDIILVGEIRDAETAEIAIRASLTGHLVFSTLHTNDSVSSVNRLIDMGVEPYLAACSLVACLAQRLVRRLCTHCKVEDTAVSRHVRQEIAQVLKIEPGDVRAWKGCGCVECNHTGYRGRVAIYEFFLLDEEIQDMVSSHIASSELRRTARKRGMKTLREDGWVKVANGLTTIDEISRITGNFLIDYHLAEEQEDEAGPGQQAGTEG
jgi:general secretion pathway protein E/type IV pilus assembly protein PilB